VFLAPSWSSVNNHPYAVPDKFAQQPALPFLPFLVLLHYAQDINQ
jgi:hypothetical protein